MVNFAESAKQLAKKAVAAGRKYYSKGVYGAKQVQRGICANPNTPQSIKRRICPRTSDSRNYGDWEKVERPEFGLSLKDIHGMDLGEQHGKLMKEQKEGMRKKALKEMKMEKNMKQPEERRIPKSELTRREPTLSELTTIHNYMKEKHPGTYNKSAPTSPNAKRKKNLKVEYESMSTPGLERRLAQPAMSSAQMMAAEETLNERHAKTQEAPHKKGKLGTKQKERNNRIRKQLQMIKDSDMPESEKRAIVRKLANEYPDMLGELFGQ
jgi:hypothetical protein